MSKRDQLPDLTIKNQWQSLSLHSCGFVQTWSQVSQLIKKMNESTGLLTGLFVIQLMLIKQCAGMTRRRNNHCQKYQFNLLWKDRARPAGCQYPRNPDLRCVMNSIGNRQIPWKNYAFLFQTRKALVLLIIFRLIQNALTLAVSRFKVRGPFYVLPVSWQPVLKPQPWSAAAGKRLATRPHCAPAAFCLDSCIILSPGR